MKAKHCEDNPDVCIFNKCSGLPSVQARPCWYCGKMMKATKTKDGWKYIHPSNQTIQLTAKRGR